MPEQPLSETPDEGRMMAVLPQVWVLADDRPGNVNQALGLAEALGEPFAVKTIGYRQIARLPNWLLPANLCGITSASKDALMPPWPNLVIGAGRRMAPIGRWLKRQNPSLCLVQLMWPGSAEDFDLIAVPEHDRVPNHPVIMRTLGAPHRLNPRLLKNAAAELNPELSKLPKPHIACLVGGTSKHVTMMPKDAVSLVEGALELANQRGGSVLLTTSRRTDQACTTAVVDALKGRHFLYCWQPEGRNPYLGILGHADAIVVSADSASMCTEACAVGCPVFLHSPSEGVPEKFKRLHRRMFAHGCMKPLGSPWFEVRTPPENPAKTIALAVRELYVRRNGAFLTNQLASETTEP